MGFGVCPPAFGGAGDKERSQEKDRGDRRNKAWLGVQVSGLGFGV